MVFMQKDVKKYIMCKHTDIDDGNRRRQQQAIATFYLETYSSLVTHVFVMVGMIVCDHVLKYFFSQTSIHIFYTIIPFCIQLAIILTST